jgi:hypothetical protein
LKSWLAGLRRAAMMWRKVTWRKVTLTTTTGKTLPISGVSQIGQLV